MKARRFPKALVAAIHEGKILGSGPEPGRTA
jgi:hypothetical protein